MTVCQPWPLLPGRFTDKQVANISRDYGAKTWQTTCYIWYAHLPILTRTSLPLETRLQRLSDPDGLARPSWSWVGQWESLGRGEWLRTEYSSTLDVTADDVQWNFDCTVVKSVAETVNENPFGAVSRAYLTICCQMIELTKLIWGRKFVILTSTFLERAMPNLVFHLDTYNESRGPGVPRSVADRVFLIRTSKRPNTQSAWSSNMLAVSIVYPAPCDGQYYRIGVCQQHWKIRDLHYCFSTERGWSTRTITFVSVSPLRVGRQTLRIWQ